MNQYLQQLAGPFKKGLLLGAMASLGIYGSIRLLFTGFDFTLWEEVSNIVKIVTTGGLLAGLAVIFFLLLESTIIYSRANKLSLSAIGIKKMSTAALIVVTFGCLLKWLL